MENLKQIIYREEDGVIMIIPENDNTQVIPRFKDDLSPTDAKPLDDLKTFCLTKVNELLYIVYLADEDRLDIQSKSEVICLALSEMQTDEKDIVTLAIDKCNQLLN